MDIYFFHGVKTNTAERISKNGTAVNGNMMVLFPYTPLAVRIYQTCRHMPRHKEHTFIVNTIVFRLPLNKGD